jgi:hypothetical protein
MFCTPAGINILSIYEKGTTCVVFFENQEKSGHWEFLLLKLARLEQAGKSVKSSTYFLLVSQDIVF